MNARFHGRATNLLTRLRAKPDHIKKSVSLILTVIIFSGVLFVWVSSWDARMRDQEIRDKTVSPMAGMALMFDGFVSGFKDRISGVSSPVENGEAATLATSTDSFDLSGVVVLDASASSTQGALATTTKAQ